MQGIVEGNGKGEGKVKGLGKENSKGNVKQVIPMPITDTQFPKLPKLVGTDGRNMAFITDFTSAQIIIDQSGEFLTIYANT